MGESAAARRARAIEGFAAVLTELRESVGTPSFRTMAGHSHAISHTTLHEAVKGNRLPSWSTTVEFVKACGADPADYRDRWELANAAVGCAQAGIAGSRRSVAMSHVPAQARAQVSAGVRTAGVALVQPPPGEPPQPTEPPTPGEPAPQPMPEPMPEPEPTPQPEPLPPVGRGVRHRRAVLAGAAAGVAVLVGCGVALALAQDGNQAAASPSGPTAADCPVRQQNPPPAPPTHAGDRAAYVADLTLPDCSHVGHGQTVRKVWRFKNAGSVPWRGRSLHRVDLPQRRGQCQTIPDVAVPDTAPGELVDISVEVTTPQSTGFCFVRFKMVDSAGRVAFPGSRPVNFQVVVD